MPFEVRLQISKSEVSSKNFYFFSILISEFQRLPDYEIEDTNENTENMSSDFYP